MDVRTLFDVANNAFGISKPQPAKLEKTWLLEDPAKEDDAHAVAIARVFDEAC